MSHLISIVVEGVPVPQSRPKIATVPFPRVFYSRPSTAYRKALVGRMTTVKGEGEPGRFPIRKAQVCLTAFGMRKNADPDNLAKQVLDALVEAGILAGDEWPHVPELIVRCQPKLGGKRACIQIEVWPLVEGERE